MTKHNNTSLKNYKRKSPRIRAFKSLPLFLSALLVLCLFPGCKKTETAEQTSPGKEFEKGPLRVAIMPDKGEMGLGELLRLEITSKIKSGYELQWPEIERGFENYLVFDIKRSDPLIDENGNIAQTCLLELEPMETGIVEIPSLKFTFTEMTGEEPKEYTLETEPVDIVVLTEYVGADPNDPNQLQPAEIERIMSAPPNPVIIISVTAGILLTVILLFCFIYLKRKKSRQKVRIFKPAHQIALERLGKLREQNLIQQGLVKPFYQRISGILRRYIEDRFGLRAPERTTEEFLHELKYARPFGDEDRDLLADFLKHCDMVKFAEYRPDSEMTDKTFELAESFIEKTKDELATIDVTDMRENDA